MRELSRGLVKGGIVLAGSRVVSERRCCRQVVKWEAEVEEVTGVVVGQREGEELERQRTEEELF